MKTFIEYLTEAGIDINVDKKPLLRPHGKPEEEVPEDDTGEEEEDGEEGDEDLEEPEEGDEESPEGEEPEGEEPPPPPAKKKFDFSSLGKR